MKKATKIWILISALLIIAGSIAFFAVMTLYRWDFGKLNTVEYKSNTYEITEEFDRIMLDTETADIVLFVSDNGKCRVVCDEEDKIKYSVDVSGGVLNVKTVNEKKPFDFIGIGFYSPKVKIYLPKTEYDFLNITEHTGNIELPSEFTFNKVDISLSTGDVVLSASVNDSAEIKTSTGEICVKNTNVKSLKLSVTTGEVTVDGVKCENLASNGSTGEILLRNVNVSDKISIERSTGSVIFDRTDASVISVKTQTGDVKGTLLSDKVFVTDTSTGEIDVPKTVTGGKCEIITTTGDIILSVAE